MKVVVWGDLIGAEKTASVVGATRLAGIVGAANRQADWMALESLAHRHGVPFLIQPFRRDDPACQEFTASLQRLCADAFLVNSYSMILPKRWFAMPSLGTVNVHCALLPGYRGANTLNWVLVNGESETGVTVHFIDDGVDTGDIILQRRQAIAVDDTALTLRTKLASVWPGMLEQVLAWLETGTCPRHPQTVHGARHWPRRHPEDGRIDWSWPAVKIYNLIRALVKPWPGAFYDAPDGTRVTLDAFHSLDDVERLQTRLRRRAA